MKILFFLVVFKCGARADTGLPWEDYAVIPVAALALALMSGVFSGLTVGLMAMDEFSLRLKLESGTELEKYYSSRILPLLADHHLLLVTLLLANAIVAESLPIVLSVLTGEVLAVVLGVVATLVLGEVIPQSLCTAKYKIPIASAFSKFVRVAIVLLFPVSYPIARILDRFVGKQSDRKKFTNEELKMLFTLQLSRFPNAIEESQVSIINRAIDMKEKVVKDFLIPISSLFFVSAELEITCENLEIVAGRNYNYVPVRDGEGEWIGVLDVKKLVCAELGTKICELDLCPVKFFDENLDIFKALDDFTCFKYKFALVKNELQEVVGAISRDDVFSQILKMERINVGKNLKKSDTDNYNGAFKFLFTQYREMFNKKNLNMRSPLIQEIQFTSCDSSYRHLADVSV